MKESVRYIADITIRQVTEYTMESTDIRNATPSQTLASMTEPSRTRQVDVVNFSVSETDLVKAAERAKAMIDVSVK